MSVTQKITTPARRVKLQEMQELQALAEALRHAVGDFVRSVKAQANEPTSAQSETLAHLDRAGPISVAALAALRGVKHQSMRQVVEVLEGDGLVFREPDPTDGRSQRIVLTAAGQAVLASARAARSQWLADVLATKLALADLDILRVAIPVLRNIAGKDAAEK